MIRIVAAAAAVLLLSGCSSDGDPAASTGPSTSPSTSPSSPEASPSAVEPAWNPCSGLRPAAISRALGTEVTIETGTVSTMRCALIPTVDGDPTLDVNYAWMGLPLDAMIDQMGVDAAATVTSPRIVEADGARLIVNRQDRALAVSGFVQNGDLIQTVNAFALAPYDAAAVVTATRVVLTQLSQAAPDRP